MTFFFAELFNVESFFLKLTLSIPELAIIAVLFVKFEKLTNIFSSDLF